MHRWLAGALCALALLVSARPAVAFLYVSGDAVGVWVKNGFELILNLGPVGQLGQGTVGSFQVPAEFDGDLVGAKFTALGVPDYQRVYDHGFPPDPPTPQPNIALSTDADPTLIDPVHIGDAQAVLDSTSGTGWFALLNTIGPPGSSGGQVLENTDSLLEISTDLVQSYTKNVGFNSDAIGSTPTIPSTAVVIDPLANGSPYSIAVYEVVQDVKSDLSALVTDVTSLGTFGGDNGASGNAILGRVPEPGSEGLAAVAIAVLTGLSRRRRALSA